MVEDSDIYMAHQQKPCCSVSHVVKRCRKQGKNAAFFSGRALNWTLSHSAWFVFPLASPNPKLCGFLPHRAFLGVPICDYNAARLHCNMYATLPCRRRDVSGVHQLRFSKNLPLNRSFLDMLARAVIRVNVLVCGVSIADCKHRYAKLVVNLWTIWDELRCCKWTHK